MSSFTKLTDMDFDRIKESMKVRSLKSHIDGIVQLADPVAQELEIEWTQGDQSSVTRNHISKLGSVVAFHG